MKLWKIPKFLINVQFKFQKEKRVRLGKKKKKKIVLVSTIKNENTLSCQRKTTQIQGNNILNKETRENRIIFF